MRSLSKTLRRLLRLESLPAPPAPPDDAEPIGEPPPHGKILLEAIQRRRDQIAADPALQAACEAKKQQSLARGMREETMPDYWFDPMLSELFRRLADIACGLGDYLIDDPLKELAPPFNLHTPCGLRELTPQANAD